MTTTALKLRPSQKDAESLKPLIQLAYVVFRIPAHAPLDMNLTDYTFSYSQWIPGSYKAGWYRRGHVSSQLSTICDVSTLENGYEDPESASLGICLENIKHNKTSSTVSNDRYTEVWMSKIENIRCFACILCPHFVHISLVHGRKNPPRSDSLVHYHEESLPTFYLSDHVQRSLHVIVSKTYIEVNSLKTPENNLYLIYVLWYINVVPR